MNHASSAQTNTPFLELNIEGFIDLIELTARINKICQQAEETQAMLNINLTDCSLNIADLPNSIQIQDINRWEQAIRQVERLPGLVLAVACGSLNGPAFELFLAADYRIVRTNARFNLPNNQGQIWPGMMMHRLVHQIGMTRCRQLFLGIQNLTPDYALSIGLIDNISDDTEIVSIVASRLSSISNKEFAIQRQLMLEALTTPFEEALGTHLAACDRELRRLNDWKPTDPRGYDQ